MQLLLNLFFGQIQWSSASKNDAQLWFCFEFFSFLFAGLNVNSLSACRVLYALKSASHEMLNPQMIHDIIVAVTRGRKSNATDQHECWSGNRQKYFFSLDDHKGIITTKIRDFHPVRYEMDCIVAKTEMMWNSIPSTNHTRVFRHSHENCLIFAISCLKTLVPELVCFWV